jgi:hypothetical protein
MINGVAGGFIALHLFMLASLFSFAMLHANVPPYCRVGGVDNSTSDMKDGGGGSSD